MRIGYIINSLEGGGAAFPVPAVAGALRSLGGIIHLFALSRADGRAIPAIEKIGLPYSVLDGLRQDHGAALRWLVSSLSAFSPDVLITSLTRATILGQLSGQIIGVPVASWQHNAFLKPANRYLLRMSKGLSRTWLADSESVAALSVERLRIPKNRMIVWPLFRADPNLPVARAWRPGEVLRIGSLGRLHPNKGYDVLAVALAILKEQGFRSPVPFSVTIGGDGRERVRLERLTSDIMQLVGFVARPHEFLAELHAYVQPSRGEGLCIAAHEAMQSGLPVIGSQTGEMSYSILHAETGYLVKPGDPISLANALKALLEAPAKTATMGEKGRARLLDRFGPAVFDAAAARVYQQLSEMR